MVAYSSTLWKRSTQPFTNRTRESKTLIEHVLAFWIFLVLKISTPIRLSNFASILPTKIFNSFSSSTFSNWNKKNTIWKQSIGIILNSLTIKKLWIWLLSGKKLDLFKLDLFWSKSCTKYRVAQQCCPGGNRPETPRRPLGDPPQGVSGFFGLNHW